MRKLSAIGTYQREKNLKFKKNGSYFRLEQTRRGLRFKDAEREGMEGTK